jgi:hypothetical protein
MASSLSWIDHDSTARERTLRILSLFQEKESRDELGLGSVRDSFADQLFPGTSTIQTRLRYMLFVPWIYHSLEEKRLSAENFAIQADELERELVQPLMYSDDQAGVFGKTAGKRLKRLPSSVYWAGLGVWGVRLTPFSQDEYHKRIDESYRRRNALKALEKDAKARGDDIDLEQRMATLSWHPRLPLPPEDFPTAVNFALSREEAEFIRDRIHVACPNSLLSFLALHCEPADCQAPWEHPDYGRFPEQHKELLTHARLVENQELFDRLDWLPPNSVGTISYYAGQLNGQLLNWLSTRKRAPQLIFFPDYDGVGLLNYAKLLGSVCCPCEFWLMPGWQQLLKHYGNNAVWQNTQSDFETAIAKLQNASVSEEFRLFCASLSSEGLALEHEAVWLINLSTS